MDGAQQSASIPLQTATNQPAISASTTSRHEQQRQSLHLPKVAILIIVFVLTFSNLAQLKSTATVPVIQLQDQPIARTRAGDEYQNEPSQARSHTAQSPASRLGATSGSATAEDTVASQNHIRKDASTSNRNIARRDGRNANVNSISSINKRNWTAMAKQPPVPKTKSEQARRDFFVSKLKKTNESLRREEDAPTQAPKLTRLPTHRNVTFLLPKPIFVASLPKSGTTSAWRYFLCGGQTASHLYARLPDNTTIKSGHCMMRNEQNGRPLLEGCGDYDVWSDTGSIIVTKQRTKCYYPAVYSLDKFYEGYPNATIVLFNRDTKAWVKSAKKWGKGMLTVRWQQCGMTKGRNTTVLTNFYNWHKQMVRDFALTHPSLTYVEVSIDDPMAGAILQNRTGIPSTCLADCKPTFRNRCDVSGQKAQEAQEGGGSGVDGIIGAGDTSGGTGGIDNNGSV